MAWLLRITPGRFHRIGTNMWIRQEYKPEKQRFEIPFELEFHRVLTSERSDGTIHEFSYKSVLKLEQSNAALGTTVELEASHPPKCSKIKRFFLRITCRRVEY